jgi:class I fructose-bisphosphate aldolase
MQHNQLLQVLGSEAEDLLIHQCEKIPRSVIHPPSPEHVERVFANSDRSIQVQANLRRLYEHGRLGGSGYLSVFPVDQGIEHTAAYSFYRNPGYFDPEMIVRMAIEGGTSGVASTLGVLGLVSRKYARQIPFILKINHNELLTYPNKHDQVMFASVEQAAEMGCAGVGATIYFGSAESNRQLVEVARAFARAHELGLFTMLWCYPRNNAFAEGEHDVTNGIDISGQACHLGVTIQADIIKQKLPNAHHGFAARNFAVYSDEMYNHLLTDHPIDLIRYQVANCYAGKISLINSGGDASGSADDVRDAVRTAVINKRGGGAGLIIGRKIFNRSFAEGIQLLHDIQDVYLDERIGLA